MASLTTATATAAASQTKPLGDRFTDAISKIPEEKNQSDSRHEQDVQVVDISYSTLCVQYSTDSNTRKIVDERKLEGVTYPVAKCITEKSKHTGPTNQSGVSNDPTDNFLKQLIETESNSWIITF